MKYNKHYKTFLLSEAEEDNINEIYTHFENNFSIKQNEDYNFDFKRFETFNHYSEIKIINCIDLDYNKENFQIIFINVKYRFVGGKYGDRLINENTMFGVKKLKNNHGKILIREEKIFDKIIEFFNKTEIDLKEDIEFSDRFFILSENENTAKVFFNNANRKLLKSLSEEENFIIEISEQELIIGNCKPINILNANQIAEFLKNNI